MNYKQRFITDLGGMLAAGSVYRVDDNSLPYMVREPAPPPERHLNSLDKIALLWHSLLETLVDLSQSRFEPDDFIRTIKNAARMHVTQLNGSDKVFAAKIMSELPRLINIPLLLDLAKNGLHLPHIMAMRPANHRARQNLVIGSSDAFKQALKQVEATAASEISIFLNGETGSGKGIMARYLHDLSPRKTAPFIKINCASLAANLWESELFGHVKGAFTGAAANNPGYIRAAHGGTLFLDEIGETTLEFQSRLLTALEDKIVYPVGSTRGSPVDFRLISASHIPLQHLVEQNRFLPALMYRLMVVPIYLPPLRERKEDLPALIEHFLEHACLLAKRTRRLHSDTTALLLAYSWPGNVRELMNLMHRLVTLAPNFYIYPADLPSEISGQANAKTTACPDSPRHGYETVLREKAGINPKYVNRLNQLLLAVRSSGQINNRMMREALNCSDSTVKNILSKLTRAGVLTAHGQRGGRYYKVCPPGTPVAPSHTAPYSAL